ncbi:MAG: universal stress protein [Candidatus Thorarchaeota archaeon]|nr:universal stress protein [Candidatus Thorarchaeota archaeon]
MNPERSSYCRKREIVSSHPGIRNAIVSESQSRVQIKRILAAVDGSEYSDKAVKYACAIAGPLSAEVYLLYVVAMLVNATPYGDAVTDQPFLALQKVGEDVLARAKRVARDNGCEAVDLISYGDAAAQIIEVAQAKSVDLIVMGTRGIGGIKRLFVGSTSDRVIRQASCPVMVVR